MLARCLKYIKMRFICHGLMLIIVCELMVKKRRENHYCLCTMLQENYLHLSWGYVAILTMNETKQFTQKGVNSTQEERLLFCAKNVDKAFDGKQILSNLNLKIYANERIALMGPSGSGKTTILKMIAGLVEPDQGHVSSTQNVSMVFDADDLYRELSAYRNVELGLDFSKFDRAKRKEKVMHWAQKFSCLSFLDQLTSNLSAGQRKRVALARAMMKEPDILILDETFPALDPALRQEIIQTLLKLQKERNFALVFATHHEEEAKLLQAKVIEFQEISQ